MSHFKRASQPSTKTPETHLRELRRYAQARDFLVPHELVDIASGTRDTRPNYRVLFDLARKREVDIVLVWRYDRFARATQALVNALVEFRDLGVDFISYQENIDIVYTDAGGFHHGAHIGGG